MACPNPWAWPWMLCPSRRAVKRWGSEYLARPIKIICDTLLRRTVMCNTLLLMDSAVLTKQTKEQQNEHRKNYSSAKDKR